jgi:hypothetical protein
MNKAREIKVIHLSDIKSEKESITIENTFLHKKSIRSIWYNRNNICPVPFDTTHIVSILLLLKLTQIDLITIGNIINRPEISIILKWLSIIDSRHKFEIEHHRIIKTYNLEIPNRKILYNRALYEIETSSLFSHILEFELSSFQERIKEFLRILPPAINIPHPITFISSERIVQLRDLPEIVYENYYLAKSNKVMIGRFIEPITLTQSNKLFSILEPILMEYHHRNRAILDFIIKFSLPSSINNIKSNKLFEKNILRLIFTYLIQPIETPHSSPLLNWLNNNKKEIQYQKISDIYEIYMAQHNDHNIDFQFAEEIIRSFLHRFDI